LAELARVPLAAAEHIRRCCAPGRADADEGHGAPPKTPLDEWAATSQRTSERECHHARVDWPVHGSVVLPHTIHGQPYTRFSTHLCGLDGVRDDNRFHLELFFNGALWVKTDLVIDGDEGMDLVLPLERDLPDGSYTLNFRLWVGPQGIHARAHTHTHTHTHMYTRTHACTHTRVRTHTYTHECIRTSMYT